MGFAEFYQENIAEIEEILQGKTVSQEVLNQGFSMVAHLPKPELLNAYGNALYDGMEASNNSEFNAAVFLKSLTPEPIAELSITEQHIADRKRKEPIQSAVLVWVLTLSLVLGIAIFVGARNE